MSSPSTSKSTKPQAFSPPLALCSKTPPPQEPHEFNRRPPGDFGARLANARNLRPTEAPPAPPPRATPTNTVADSCPSMLQHILWPMNTGIAFQPMPKYGGIPGSYRSPYDGGGKTPGDQHLPASSTTVEEFEARYGTDALRRAAATAGDAASEGSAESDQTVGPTQPGRTISFGMMPPVAIRDKRVASAAPQATQKNAPTFAEGAINRTIFLGPFRMVRKECKDKRDSVPGMKELGAWLEVHMHENWHKVYHRDAMIPSVIYSVKVPMLDQDWLNYNQALAHFKDARELHNLLACGKEELDHVTKVHVDAANQLTWPQLTVPDQSLEEMLAGLVKQNSLGQPWDWGRPIGVHPELRPKEYGGTLEGYFPS